VLLPVLRELSRRGAAHVVMLAEPAASQATSDGLPCVALTSPSLAECAAVVLRTEPSALLLGTSVADVVERELARAARGRIPTVGVLDAMLFVERRFGPGLPDLPDLVACPDDDTAERLRRAGADSERLVVTGNPALEAIAPSAAPAGGAAGPIDILFVSQPVVEIGRAGAPFSIDERASLHDLLAALDSLADRSPDGFRVRVRWHPIQRPDQLPCPLPNVTVAADDDPDRLRSAAKARVVVGISSTLLAEARMLPRPSIAYLPGPYWDQDDVYASHVGVRRARSAEELRAHLVDALAGDTEPRLLTQHAGAARRVAELLLGVTAPE